MGLKKLNYYRRGGSFAYWLYLKIAVVDDWCEIKFRSRRK